jgi:hypothetical protein
MKTMPSRGLVRLHKTDAPCGITVNLSEVVFVGRTLTYQMIISKKFE